MKKPFLLMLLAVSGSSLYATTRYVTLLGAGALDGTSWANAYSAASLQTAITASVAGDEVWVATGTYVPVGAGRTAAFAMKNGVAIYGSFAGTETALSERVLTGGLTSILSGERGVAGISDNCYHVVFNGAGLTTTAVLDGFVIRDANDDRTATTTDGLGGGIYNNGSGAGNVCHPTIRNCVITGNRAVFGAGIFNSGYNGGAASPVIAQCVITGNLATSGGGGIDNFGLAGTASPTITNCVIAGNTATGNAGGMYCWGGNGGNANPVVLNTVFANNGAVNGGGVVSDRLNSGAGSSGNSNPIFRNCIFWGNTAAGTGPQFYILGGATFTATYSDIPLTGQSAPHTIAGAGTGNIDADPTFFNSALGAGADEAWLTADDGFRLSGVASSAYNAGNNTGLPATDILSNNRITDGTADMGAYEFTVTVLPLTVVAFTANLQSNRNINLEWTTAAERGFRGFDIQRSGDGIYYQTIGFVPAAGHPASRYAYTDTAPQEGKNYYRLKQQDADGRYTYSAAVAVRVMRVGLRLFPNPTGGRVTITGAEEIKNIGIINSAGVTVKVQAGSNNVIDIVNLPAGIYTVRIETATEIVSQTVTKR